MHTAFDLGAAQEAGGLELLGPPPVRRDRDVTLHELAACIAREVLLGDRPVEVGAQLVEGAKRSSRTFPSSHPGGPPAFGPKDGIVATTQPRHTRRSSSTRVGTNPGGMCSSVSSTLTASNDSAANGRCFDTLALRT